MHNVYSQDQVRELFTFYPNKKAVKRDSTLYESKLVLAPVVTYTPETSFGFGVGAKYLFKFKGSGEETRTSNMPFSVKYTLHNQFIFYSGFEIFTNQEDIVIFGNLKFQNYPRSFYGIGRNSLQENEEKYNYHQILIEPLVMKNAFTKHLFIGGGIRYNHIFNVKTKRDGILENTKPLNYNGNTASGVELGMLYDSRDNLLNASNGWYLFFTHSFYDKFLGGTSKFELTKFDLRHYLKPFKKSNDVFAFQVSGYFSHGHVPFPELALFGSPYLMRGYKEGRYVAKNMIAAQVEYRKTFKNSRWGVVGFAGLGDVFNNSNELKLNELKPSAGLGVRYMIDKKEKLNIRFDWGAGKNCNNTYLGISEAF